MELTVCIKKYLVLINYKSWYAIKPNQPTIHTNLPAILLICGCATTPMEKATYKNILKIGDPLQEKHFTNKWIHCILTKIRYVLLLLNYKTWREIYDWTKDCVAYINKQHNGFVRCISIGNLPFYISLDWFWRKT